MRFNGEEVELSDEQPITWEFYGSDGVGIKMGHIKTMGTYIPQHAHSYDHTTIVARGGLRIWKDGKPEGEVMAPHGMEIEAGCLHMFQTLSDDTIFYCIHNVSRTGKMEIEREHVVGD